MPQMSPMLWSLLFLYFLLLFLLFNILNYFNINYFPKSQFKTFKNNQNSLTWTW